MNAVLSNRYTETWRRLGKDLPKPKAIVSVSAHWFGPGTGVTIAAKPRTIHDFGGFPRELYQVQYPAPGDPQLARRVQQMLAPVSVRLDDSWGLDHGIWSVLRHVYPEADVPVVQLGIDETRPASFHYDLGRKLSDLRDEGILLMGSGNLIHNLHAYAWGKHAAEPYDWTVRFEAKAKELMLAGDHRPLIDYETLGPDARLSVPTPDHYLPLLYVLGAQRREETVAFPVAGIDGGSVSMLAVQVG